MRVVLSILIAGALTRTPLGATLILQSYQDDLSLSETTLTLLSSFTNCIVYIFNGTTTKDYSFHVPTRYFLFYSQHINCAVVVGTSNSYPLVKKFTTNLLNMYTPQATSKLTRNESLTKDFFEIVLSYSVPFNYVLIFMSKKAFSFIDALETFSKFHLISAPTVYMLIFEEREVNIISLAHALQHAPYLFRVMKFELAYIQQISHLISKDFQRTVVCVKHHKTWETCRFGMPVVTHPHFCTLNIIAERLNLTVLNLKDYPASRPCISQVIVDTSFTAVAHLLSRSSSGRKYDCVNDAIFHEEFSFLCVAQVNSEGLMAFVQAYDFLTWVVTASGCTIVAATIAALARKPVGSFRERILSAAPVVLLLLIERFYGHGQVIRFASRQIVLVITIWAFGAMLLGMCYSGNMVSELTSPSYPSCPHDMKRLANKIEEYPILTDIRVSTSKETWKPFFHWWIDDYLKKYSWKNSTLASVLRQFKNIVTYAKDSPQLIPSNDTSSSKIHLVYAGSASHVSAYGMWSHMHSSKSRVLRGGNLPIFNLWSPFLVQSNSLAPEIRRILEALVECGIWKYWTESRMADSAKAYFEYSALRTETDSSEGWERTLSLATIWRDFDHFVDDETSWSTLTVDNLSAAFTFLTICLLMALGVMFNERWHVLAMAYRLHRIAAYVLIVMNRMVHTFAKLPSMTWNWAKGTRLNHRR